MATKRVVLNHGDSLVVAVNLPGPSVVDPARLWPQVARLYSAVGLLVDEPVAELVPVGKAKLLTRKIEEEPGASD